ncbi:transient receptor potential cation channel subfamily A member 1-like [Protopterus annectens]|uniref:transient receptor potential cation channel subfamily A member 1-like n=1 Tax=Protopterus annectens TaxID=7888 RepID=UPI001CFB809B|nr:transient receptor potential cation channel subfamily A member 1-like [Protopterus annectens]
MNKARRSLKILREVVKDDATYECAENEEEIPLLQQSQDIFEFISKGLTDNVKDLVAEDPECLNRLDKLQAMPLHHAAGKGNLQIIKLIINNSSKNLNVTDCNGNTPLHWATEKNQVQSIILLLEEGADPNILNKFLLSPLHIAVQLYYNEAVKVLAAHKSINVNLQGELGNTPLMLACAKDNHKGIEILLDHGALLCRQNRLGHFAIHLASFMGSKKAMEVILKRGLAFGHSFEKHINYLDKSLNSPLHLAVQGGNLEVIKFCIECGAHIDLVQADNSTAVHFAAVQGAIEAVKLMITSYKGDKDIVNILDGNMQTPLHKAAIFDHQDLAEYLISKGGRIDSIDNENRTPLLLATSCGSWKTVNLLISKGANVKLKDDAGCNVIHLAVLQQGGMKHLNKETMQNNQVRELLSDEDNEGCTPLHYACRQGVPDSVNNILGWKISIYSKSKDKKSPLHFAASYGRINTCRRLLQNITDTRLLNEGDEKGMTPLHLAAQNGHTEVVKLLLRKGALCITDYECWTSLHYAAFGGYTQTMHLLLETDLKLIDRTEDEGNTALHLAAREGHAGAVNLLLSKGAKLMLNKKNLSFFHEAIRNGKKEVVFATIESKRFHEAMRCFRHGSEYRCPVFELIEHLPEAFMLILNKAVQESMVDKRSPHFYTIYDFTYLQCPLKLQQLAKEDKEVEYEPLAALNIMVRCSRIELLTHPVCKEYLQMKWVAYGLKAHIINLTIYTLGLVPLTALIVNTNPRAAENATVSMTNPHPWASKMTYLTSTWMIMVFIVSLFGMCKEMVQIIQQRWKYLCDFSNLIDWTISVTSILFVLPLFTDNLYSWQWECGATAVFCSWVNFLLYLQRFENFGIYVVMFWEILRTLLHIALLFFFLVLAFAFTFFALLNNQTAYSTPYLSLMQTFAMMLGDINYHDSFLIPITEKKMPYPYMSFAVLILFMLLIPILLMNLLIGLAVGDIAEVQRNASIKRMAMQVSLHTNLERKLPYWYLTQVDQRTKKVYPNRKRVSGPLVMLSHVVCSGNRFSCCLSSSVEFLEPLLLVFVSFLQWFSMMSESANEQKCSRDSSLSAFEVELQKQKYRLKDISAILRKQHELIKLIIQKMEIVTEAEEADENDIFQYSRVKRQHLNHRTSKWDKVIRCIKNK